MSRNLKIALVGCGAVSELFYAPALRELERRGQATVAAIVDPDAARAQVLGSFFPGAEVVADIGLLRGVDLAVVASPPPFHAGQTIQALEAGMAVLCEKPMAISTVEAERMNRVAAEQRRVLAVGLFRRFFPSAKFVSQLVEAQLFGPVKSFSIHEGGPFSWPAKSDSFFRKKSAGGGVLLDIGVHVLDLVLHWFGNPDEVRYADDAMGGIEANCLIDLRFPQDIRGKVRLSRDWETQNKYVIEFERARVILRTGDPDHITIEPQGSSLVLSSALLEATGTGPDGALHLPALTYSQAFLAQLEDVMAAVQNQTRPAVPGEEGIRSLRLIDACYRDRTLMPMPWLTPEEIRTARVWAVKGAA